MLFLQLENQIESIQCRIIATILPAILIALTIVIFFADTVIAVVDAIQAAVIDCRILLGKPTPITPTATPILSIVPDSKPIATMNKTTLRAECRMKGIKYGKMNVAQMRQALRA